MMKTFMENSHLFGANAPFIEDLYESYLRDPASVAAEWKSYFDVLQKASGALTQDIAHAPIVAAFTERAKAGLQN